MTRLFLVALALLVSCGGGAWLGWRAGQTVAAKREAAAATQAVQDLTRTVGERVAARSVDIAAEQERSAAWIAQQKLAATLSRTLSQEISHATFVLPPLPAAGGSCVASGRTDLLGAPEFVRLYDAAARAGQPATAATAGSSH